MNLDDFPSNSNRSKDAGASQPEKKVEKVVTGTVKQKKPTNAKKLAELFVPGDLTSIGDYILTDVIVPNITKMVEDIVCNSIHMLFGRPANSGQKSTAAKVSYRDCYDDDRKRYNQSRATRSYSYDDIVFETRGDAEEVLYRMEELLDRFEVVSIADLYDMAGISCNYTDNKYGWTSLRGAKVERVSDGYVIRLPRATTL